MIPAAIAAHLQDHHIPFTHRVHARVVPAQRLAAAEGVSGYQVAKPVVLAIDGKLAIAVIPAPERVDHAALKSALGVSTVEPAPEEAFIDRFQPCEPGAEPPLCLFGLPIYVDAALAEEPFVVMRAGTHTDSVRLATEEWVRAEHAVLIRGLGIVPGNLPRS